MQRSRVNFDRDACRDAENFHRGGVQNPVRNLILFGKQQDEVLPADVDLAVPVVFEAVEFGVVTPAHAQLNRHAAVGAVTEVRKDFAGLKTVDARLIGGAFGGQGNRFHGCAEFRGVIALEDFAVGLEFRVGDGIDFHGFLLEKFFLRKNSRCCYNRHGKRCVMI